MIHEKEGRRHAHVVWSRIDAQSLIAINLPHFKVKLRDMSRDLFLDHGWELPQGLQRYGGKNPLNFTLAEWQQAKRDGKDASEIKQHLVGAWQHSDGLKAFQAALQEKGYWLAKGDRRGFVALDHEGHVYSLTRWLGIKGKAITARIGSPDALSSVETVTREIKARMTKQVRGYIRQVKEAHDDQMQPLIAERDAMVAAHRKERRALTDGQTKRWQEETAARSKRLNTGLRGLFDRLTGTRSQTITRNEREAYAALKRDRAQRNRLIDAQMTERRALLNRAQSLKHRHHNERDHMVKSIAAYLRRSEHVPDAPHHDPPQRRRTRRPPSPDRFR